MVYGNLQAEQNFLESISTLKATSNENPDLGWSDEIIF